MNIFSVDYSSLLSRARDLSYMLDDANGNISDVNDVIKELDVFWDGSANESFVRAMSNDIAKVTVLIGTIRASVKLIITALDEYQATEKVIAMMIDEI